MCSCCLLLFASTNQCCNECCVKTSLITYASTFIHKFIEMGLLGQRVHAFKIVISSATFISVKVMPNHTSISGIWKGLFPSFIYCQVMGLFNIPSSNIERNLYLFAILISLVMTEIEQVFRYLLAIGFSFAVNWFSYSLIIF